MTTQILHVETITVTGLKLTTWSKVRNKKTGTFKDLLPNEKKAEKVKKLKMKLISKSNMQNNGSGNSAERPKEKYSSLSILIVSLIAWGK